MTNSLFMLSMSLLWRCVTTQEYNRVTARLQAGMLFPAPALLGRRRLARSTLALQRSRYS
jgi:hypothetical protein